MSSPAAALAAIESRHQGLSPSEEEADFCSFIYECAEDRTDDSLPIPPIHSAEASIPEAERRRLRALGRLAAALL